MGNSVLRCGALFLIVTVLAGCDSIPFIDNTSDYKGAGRSKPLEVPPDLTAVRTSSTYNVPGSTSYSAYSQNQEAVEQNGPQPVLADVKNVRMVKAGSQRWLVVNAPAEKVWPIVREFWLDQGFAVRVENPEVGVMETEWLEADAIKVKEDKRGYGEKFDAWMDKLSGLADRRKFRTRLERGEKEGTTEIYMTHRTVAGAPDDGKNVINTQLGRIETGYRVDADKKNTAGQEFDADLDAELLRRMMVKLGLDEQKAEQVVAQAASDKRAEVIKEKDQSVTLKLNEPFDRAWRRVGLALDRIGFVTEDKNRSEGIFYVRYADTEADDPIKKKKGLLDRLKFWGGEDEEEKAAAKDDSSKSMGDKLKFWKGSADGDKSSKQYQIQVLENADDTSDVYVLTKENKRNTTTTANRIISLMYEQLK
ncbi:outer membrane protein assembly factor BamC [Methylophilus aquaticus]|uniref:Outer membrane protein assembly factor BamC n=1 Tax=Methylophilus aquaticus TaxID=1971610 RepID=A0ABT9JX45_9PROT|nr:outer membrane protein assembly factor BamC [Methylophilus aquaticus]MDP8568570.1 outer membrane protein assembly factor BamC [Methylophilus aquaticus]